MNEKYKAQQLKSSEYYAGVIDVRFTPEVEIPLEITVKKGDPIYEYRGFFGRKRVQIGEEQENKFRISEPDDYHSYYSQTLSSLESKRYHRISGPAAWRGRRNDVPGRCKAVGQKVYCTV